MGNRDGENVGGGKAAKSPFLLDRLYCLLRFYRYIAIRRISPPRSTNIGMMIGSEPDI